VAVLEIFQQLGTAAAVAKQLDLPVNKVRMILRRNGIQLQPRRNVPMDAGRPGLRKRVLELRASGMRYSVIADMCWCDRKWVKRVCLEGGK
jgi:hypothetical protein